MSKVALMLSTGLTGGKRLIIKGAERIDFPESLSDSHFLLCLIAGVKRSAPSQLRATRLINKGLKMPRLRRRALRGASTGSRSSKKNSPFWWGFFSAAFASNKLRFQTGRISEIVLAGSTTCGSSREAIPGFTPPVPFYENESNPDLRPQGRELRGQMKGAEGGKGTKTKEEK